VAISLPGAARDFWDYWSSLSSSQWLNVLFVSSMCFTLFYFVVYPSIRDMDTSGKRGKAKLSVIIIPAVLISVWFGYKDETTFHFKEFVWVPCLQFCDGVWSWFTASSCLIMVGLGLLLAGFAKRIGHELGWN